MSSDDIVLSVRNVLKCFEMYEKPVHRLYQTLCASSDHLRQMIDNLPVGTTSSGYFFFTI